MMPNVQCPPVTEVQRLIQRCSTGRIPVALHCESFRIREKIPSRDAGAFMQFVLSTPVPRGFTLLRFAWTTRVLSEEYEWYEMIFGYSPAILTYTDFPRPKLIPQEVAAHRAVGVAVVPERLSTIITPELFAVCRSLVLFVPLISMASDPLSVRPRPLYAGIDIVTARLRVTAA
jgi:hypothetical protein